jgi:hypothetical protein
MLLLMGVISFVAMPRLWKRSQEVWPETQGTLVESYVKQGVRRDSGDGGINSRSGSTTFNVCLKYRYTVDGKELHGDEKAPRQPEDDENWPEAKAIWESYKAGDAIAVYYKPSDPTRSRFTAKEPGIEFKMDILFVIAYLLGGWGMFVWGRKLLR